jgi:hypothetical protein
MKKIDLSNLSPKELLQLSAGVINELRSRGISRTGNGPIGDYAEWLVSQAYGMTLAPESNTGHDAIDRDGLRVEVKARRIKPGGSRQLSAIRQIDEQHFDYLIAVICDQNYDVISAMRIPWAVVKEKAKHDEHTNSSILTANSTIVNDERVTDITDELTALLVAMGL